MRPFCCLILLFALLPAAPAAAGELAGVTLKDRVTVGDHQLVLNGMALRKVAIVKVYVAGLYLPARQSDAEKILAADEPWHVTMHFVRDVGKDSLCEGWQDGLAANTPNASSAVSEKFDRLCGMMADVAKDDRISFTYVPGRGTEVKIEEETKGTLEGADFADALLAVWIGPDPGPGTKFKQAFLGG